MNKKIYDIAIIGSGPAGCSASIYASRYNLSNIVFGKIPGGSIFEAHKICNYPGFEEIAGYEIGEKFYNHAKKFGADMQLINITNIKKNKNTFESVTETGEIFRSKTIILATGTIKRKLSIPNEEKFIGRGISYCATCDANFFKNKIVGVVGGSNSAITAALLLSEIADKVYIIYRGKVLRGDQKNINLLLKNKKVSIIYETVITSVKGNDRLKNIILSKEYNGRKDLNLDGLFIEIGSDPNNDLTLKLGIERDASGYIIVKTDQSTNIKGVWAAGDVTTGSNKLQQVVTAVSEGAIAADSVYKYLKA